MIIFLRVNRAILTMASLGFIKPLWRSALKELFGAILASTMTMTFNRCVGDKLYSMSLKSLTLYSCRHRFCYCDVDVTRKHGPFCGLALGRAVLLILLRMYLKMLNSFLTGWSIRSLIKTK